MPTSLPRRFSRSQHQRAKRIPTICVVDPQASDYQGWETLADVNGAALKRVATAAEGLRMARTEQVDLWVVNVDLPDLSGPDLCRMIKSRSSASTVYLVADQYSREVERSAWAARATLFGCKPGHTAGLQDWLCSLSPGRSHSPQIL